jgi:hypothetical protein
MNHFGFLEKKQGHENLNCYSLIEVLGGWLVMIQTNILVKINAEKLKHNVNVRSVFEAAYNPHNVSLIICILFI